MKKIKENQTLRYYQNLQSILMLVLTGFLGLDTANFDLSEEEINFITNFRKLPEKEKLKIEGMVELKLAEMQD